MAQLPPTDADLAVPAAELAPSNDPAVEVVTAQEPAVPDGAELSPAEVLLVEQAVEFLNRVSSETGLRLAQTVSDYVVTTFCAGDAAVLSSHVPLRSNTIAALSRHPNLQMGANTLRRLVRIGLQVKELPAEVALRLTPPQHRALLGVKDPERKVELARAALADKWTPEQIAAAVAGPVPRDGPRLGRPPKAELVKQVAAVVKGAKGLRPEGFAGLGEQEREEVLAGLREVLAVVEGVLGGVGDRVDQG